MSMSATRSGLVVEDSTRQQSLLLAVGQHPVVVALPGADPNPALLDC